MTCTDSRYFVDDVPLRWLQRVRPAGRGLTAATRRVFLPESAWAQIHWSQVKYETNSRVHKILRTFSFALTPLLRPKKETEKREAERRDSRHETRRKRIIIPPELGPPVKTMPSIFAFDFHIYSSIGFTGRTFSTFFSSKQFEVFDVELLSVQNCQRRTVLAFYSDFVRE
ncbi:hypothetical protein FF2_039928 [Malus domestica]